YKFMLDLAQYQIGGSTAREIAASVETAVREGGVETGERLPTVRDLARRLGRQARRAPHRPRARI
ncbi:MAG TPA: hypothetical protein VK898_06975, partial [Chloroflexota bacterium]|nr:hypothetical protein [Chloroflexota bacterium]